MRKVGIGAAIAVLAMACTMSLRTPQVLADQAPPPMKLKVGDVAPDFKLSYFDGNDLKEVNLSQYHGKKNVVLAFYIFAFTGG